MITQFDTTRVRAMIRKMVAQAEVTLLETFVWGNIPGTLSDQLDLQSALDAKSAVGHGHVQSSIVDLVSDLASKQATLVSGTNIKTVGGVSVLGSGNIAITVNWGSIGGTLADQTDLQSALSAKAASSHTHPQSDITNLASDLAAKQATLVSATNIKTINGATVLGSGDLTVSGSAAWGSITGTLSAQTDLQTALNGKSATGHTHAQSDITNLTTDLAAKQATLVSATNIKTVNGSSLLGAGNLVISGSAAWGSVTGTLSDQTDLQSALNAKQATLVSATNIKTVNGSTLLGSGDLVVSSGYHHVSKTAGATTTAANTTPVNVTGASFAYIANSVYMIRFMGRLNSAAATTGAGLQFDLSTAVTAIDVQTIHQLAAAGTLTGGYSIADDASAGVSSGVPAGPLDVPISMRALLVTGANAGTAQLRFRSETTAVTELLAGAVLVVEKVQ